MGGQMKKVAFYTLGCKVNQYETEAMAELFEAEDYEVVDFEERADVYVINTCTVTNLSDRKSRQMIRRARRKNEDAIIAVVGCYAQTSPDEVSNIPGVNLIIGTKQRNKIVDYIREIENTGGGVAAHVDDIMRSRDFEELKVESYKERTRAFLKIQEGCSQFCTYCIIPYARGPIRSRQPRDVLDEVRKLATSGFKEVVLTGIHVASYGKDIGDITLLDIIKKVHEVEGIERIRLGSIEPTTLTDEFIASAKNLQKLCPHYHISLQSGCDKILKKMNRRYTSDDYRKVVDALRANIPDVAITTDVMVGFPGETDEDFEETYRFVDEISFAHMHVFKYSPRKGTPAAKYSNQVSPEKKEERSSRLMELSKKKTEEFNSRFVGKTMKVLIEKETENGDGMLEGLTPNYIRVLCKGEEHLKGRIVDVRLFENKMDHVIGRIENVLQ
jgi:threonylcarbamoyladenosine tRNA methylthiotransferase MtaB